MCLEKVVTEVEECPPGRSATELVFVYLSEQLLGGLIVCCCCWSRQRDDDEMTIMGGTALPSGWLQLGVPAVVGLQTMSGVMARFPSGHRMPATGWC